MSVSLDEVRGQLPVTGKWIYLDNAGAGPLPLPTLRSVSDFLSKWSHEGEPWEEGLRSLMEAKRLYGGLINAPSPDHMAAVVNATTAYNKLLTAIVVAERAGDWNVVVDAHNFPTNFYTLHSLRKNGFLKEVRFLRSVHSEDKQLEVHELVDRSTIAIIIDHVSWKTGVKTDLAQISKLAKDYGSLLITDAFHSVGSVPVDVRGLQVDALYFGSYKWLMSPHGAALLYVSQDVIHRAKPLCTGWLAVEDSVIERMRKGEPMFARELSVEDVNHPITAERFEDGTQPLHSFAGLVASFHFLDRFGWERVYRRVENLARSLRESLGEHALQLHENEESGIVIVRTRDSLKISHRLEKHYKVKVSARPGFVRLSPHFYNTEEEVERAASALTRELRRYS